MQPKSIKYIDRINSNGVKTSIERIKGGVNGQRKVETFYVGEPKQRN